MDIVVQSTTEAAQLAQWLILASNVQFTVEKMRDHRVIFYIHLFKGDNDNRIFRSRLNAYLQATFIVVEPHHPEPARPA